MSKLMSGAPQNSGSGRTHRAKRRGFTLIEVVCATAVTVIGLVSTFYLVGLSTGVNSDAKNVSQAYQAAQQEIELVRNIPFTTLTTIVKDSTPSGTPEARFLNATGTGDDASRPGDSGYPGLIPSLGNLQNGRGGIIITNDATAGAQAKHVTVVIRWTEKGGQERSAIVGTIIAQGGMNAR